MLQLVSKKGITGAHHHKKVFGERQRGPGFSFISFVILLFFLSGGAKIGQWVQDHISCDSETHTGENLRFCCLHPRQVVFGWNFFHTTGMGYQQTTHFLWDLLWHGN